MGLSFLSEFHMEPLRQFQTAEKSKAAHAAGLSGTFSGKRKSVLELCLNFLCHENRILDWQYPLRQCRLLESRLAISRQNV